MAELRIEQVARRVGLSRAQILARVQRGEFPAPIVAVPRKPFIWDSADVAAWTPPPAPEREEEAIDESAERRFRAAVAKADRAHGEALYQERVAERLRREATQQEAA